MKRLTTLLSAILIVGSAFAQKPDGALVAISHSVRWLLNSGHGVAMTITNVESGEAFYSRAIGYMSNDVVIEDVPAGTYRVTYIDMPFGGGGFVNKTEAMGDYFGIIEVEGGNAYYLGTFRSSLDGMRPWVNVIMSRTGEDVSGKLARFAARAHYTGWTSIAPAADSFAFFDFNNQSEESFFYNDGMD